MRDKTTEEILDERHKAVDIAKKRLNLKEGEYDVLPSYFGDDYKVPNDCKASGVYWLGESLLLLCKADVVVFCKGWEEYRGCKLEHQVCKDYGIECIEIE